MMKKVQCLAIMIIVFFTATSCQNVSRENPIRGSYAIEENQPTSEIKYLRGETIYVPIYSSIFHYKDFRTVELTATLSIILIWIIQLKLSKQTIIIRTAI